MICGRCFYNTNCQFIGRNKKAKVSGCSCFKDKDLILELPCRVGHPVYRIGEGYVSLVPLTWINDVRNFGETVFLTEAEAQAKLDELKAGIQ